MKHRTLISPVFLLASLVCLCASPARAESVSPAQYRAQLHEIEEKVGNLEGDPGRAAQAGRGDSRPALQSTAARVRSMSAIKR